VTFRRVFITDSFGWVIARGTDGSTLKSQRVEAHLLFAILDELKAIREAVATQDAAASAEKTGAES
jgi:hypothetical protein